MNISEEAILCIKKFAKSGELYDIYASKEKFRFFFTILATQSRQMIKYLPILFSSQIGHFISQNLPLTLDWSSIAKHLFALHFSLYNSTVIDIDWLV